MQHTDIVEWVTSKAWRTHDYWSVQRPDNPDFPGNRESVPTVDVPAAVDRGRFGGRFVIVPHELVYVI